MRYFIGSLTAHTSARSKLQLICSRTRTGTELQRMVRRSWLSSHSIARFRYRHHLLFPSPPPSAQQHLQITLLRQPRKIGSAVNVASSVILVCYTHFFNVGIGTDRISASNRKCSMYTARAPRAHGTGTENDPPTPATPAPAPPTPAAPAALPFSPSAMAVPPCPLPWPLFFDCTPNHSANPTTPFRSSTLATTEPRMGAKSSSMQSTSVTSSHFQMATKSISTPSTSATLSGSQPPMLIESSTSSPSFSASTQPESPFSPSKYLSPFHFYHSP
ncbi:hypothetical protein B0H10DRAFT_1109361 [Mycena sp. CBHHK59/15]|nr:hypothetical protein B0H10DRAFT_1109361 [Mycena sp. CBHHK59/15]